MEEIEVPGEAGAIIKAQSDGQPSHVKLLLLALFALALFGSIVLLRGPAAQSGWRWERKGGWNAYVEKLVPGEEARLFMKAFPSAAAEAFARVGASGFAIPSGELTVFAAWGSYRSVRIDDPLISRSLRGKPSGELRQVAFMAGEFELDEPVANCYVSADGRYFFLDLRAIGAEGKGGLEAAVTHGVAHSLARSQLPAALAREAGAAFRFLDEAAALFLADSARARARGRAYAELALERWAPGGPLLGGGRPEALFSADRRPPEYFAAAALFARAIALDAGEAAMGALAARLAAGGYGSLDELARPLASDLDSLLERFGLSGLPPE